MPTKDKNDNKNRKRKQLTKKKKNTHTHTKKTFLPWFASLRWPHQVNALWIGLGCSSATGQGYTQVNAVRHWALQTPSQCLDLTY